jgi:hypothetical protein
MSPVVTKVALPSSESIYTEYQALGIELTRSGKQWKALCPFPDHMDTSPSFFVYSDGGFHCFGCGAHGSLEDIYTYFDVDFRYHYSRIDLTTVQDIAIDFTSKLRKNLEKRICLAFEKNDSDCFTVFDAFDRLWLDLNFMTFANQLEMIIVVKRTFYKLIQELEGNDERAETN